MAWTSVKISCFVSHFTKRGGTDNPSLLHSNSESKWSFFKNISTWVRSQRQRVYSDHYPTNPKASSDIWMGCLREKDKANNQKLRIGQDRWMSTTSPLSVGELCPSPNKLPILFGKMRFSKEVSNLQLYLKKCWERWESSQISGTSWDSSSPNPPKWYLSELMKFWPVVATLTNHTL